MIADFAGSAAAASTIGAIPVAPVEAAAGEGRALPFCDDQLGAIAVLFDLVQPAVALGRLGDQRGQLKLDEPQCPHVPLLIASGRILDRDHHLLAEHA